jgi:hypothetical protein
MVPQENAPANSNILEVLIRQIGENAEVNPILGKALGDSDIPSFSSQSAICCIASPPCDEPHAVTNDDI